MISPLAAAQAYASAQQGASAIGGVAAPEAGPNFAEMLQGVMSETMATSKAAETAMAAGVQGKAELIDVVTAISSAEHSLETMMAVRDQVISAYQEILRMPI